MPAPPRVGGIANGIELLRATALARKTGMGFINTFVAPDSSRGWVHRLRRQLGAYAHFVATVLRARPGIVHIKTSAGVNFYQNAGYALLARVLGRPTVLQIHDGTFPEFYRGAGPFMRRGIRALLNVPSALIALSEGWAAYFRTFGIRDVVVVPNGLRTIRFRRAQGDRGRFGIPEDRLVVVFMGTGSVDLDLHKGLKDLVTAAARVRREEHPELLLALAGGASHDTLLGEMLGSGGWMSLGAIDQEEKPVVFRSVDVFVLASRAENMPNTLLEAMAAGCAVIATPVGAVPEMVTDGTEGLLVEVGDVDALARALSRLAADRTLRISLGEHAAQRASAQYDLCNVEVALAAVYEEHAPGVTRGG